MELERDTERPQRINDCVPRCTLWAPPPGDAILPALAPLLAPRPLPSLERRGRGAREAPDSGRLYAAQAAEIALTIASGDPPCWAHRSAIVAEKESASGCSSPHADLYALCTS
mmetsp:Transcript_2333/g.6944  ORF Transcript_2333/g.6944 Transcript_2333/m.6944 type:complete len:113 (-) Transcript_2333:1234-1572(-)